MSSLRTDLMEALANGDVADDDGYTALDLIVYRCRTDSGSFDELKSILRNQIIEIIETADDATGLIELFVSLEINDPSLADSIERFVTSGRLREPRRRMVAVTLLRALGRSLPPQYIVNDAELRDVAPLQWLDLSLPVMSDVGEAQNAVVSMITRKELGVDEITPRLHLLWTVCGATPIPFLQRVASAFSDGEQRRFIELVADEFEIKLKLIETTVLHHLPRRMGKLMNIAGGATIPPRDKRMLADHNKKARQNAVVQRFEDFGRAAQR